MRSCERCKGLHLPDLPEALCPNAISFKAGRLQKLVADGTKCTFWVKKLKDGTKLECGGVGHSWEDHRDAVKMNKEQNPGKPPSSPDKKDSQDGKGKGKGGKGKKKGRETSNSLVDEQGQQHYDDLINSLLSGGQLLD